MAKLVSVDEAKVSELQKRLWEARRGQFLATGRGVELSLERVLDEIQRFLNELKTAPE